MGSYQIWSGLSQVHFLCLVSGKKLIKSKIHAAESEKWFCTGHPKYGLAGAAFTQISSYLTPTFDYPDLVKHFHLQGRIMGNGRVPWLDGANRCFCYICKDNLLFERDCSFLREHFLL